MEPQNQEITRKVSDIDEEMRDSYISDLERKNKEQPDDEVRMETDPLDEEEEEDDKAVNTHSIYETSVKQKKLNL